MNEFNALASSPFLDVAQVSGKIIQLLAPRFPSLQGNNRPVHVPLACLALLRSKGVHFQQKLQLRFLVLNLPCMWRSLPPG